LWTGAFVTFLFINLCIFMGFNMLLPTLSLYLESKFLAEKEIGMVFGSFMISAIAARLGANALAGRLGPMWAARTGLIILFFGNVFFILYNHMFSYLAARLLQGAGFGLTSTLLVSLASQSMPYSRLGEGLGYLGLGATVSLALGPYAGIFVSERFGYETMFVSVSICYLFAFLISLFLPGALSKKPPKREPDPGAPPKRIETRVFPAATLMLIYGMGVSSVGAYLAIFAKEASLPSVAVFFMVSTIGTVTSRLFAGKLYDNKGHRYVVPPAMVLTFSAMLIILSEPPAALMWFGAVIYGLGAGAAFPSFQTLALTSVPPDRRTVASAYFFVAFDLGLGLGAFVMGIAAGVFHTYGVAFAASMVFIAILSVVYFILYPGKNPKGVPGPPSGTPAPTPPGSLSPGPAGGESPERAG
jgi:MFS family permease